MVSIKALVLLDCTVCIIVLNSCFSSKMRSKGWWFMEKKRQIDVSSGKLSMDAAPN